MTSTRVRILGIDPGSQRTGIGIIDVAADGRMLHVHSQPLVLLAAEDFPGRLRLLLDGLWQVIDEFRPSGVAIEQVFLSKNPMSALKLGQARGAAMAACVARDLKVAEYAAREIKLALVGKGGADKAQVQHMVGILLNLKGKLQADAADALAVAITHAHVRASAARLGVDTRQAWGR
ncbi:MAG: crossover junction endodeoxyribonuclease RuvC [Pseudoxanthomonas suwonensis]|nr:crossover junction endodeoxyribonuclease RuvC [Pseudoxanthomonas suwonensis]